MQTNRLFWTIAIVCNVLFADDYNFDMSEFEKKTFEVSGTVEFRPSITIPNIESPAWKLKYKGVENPPGFLDNYLLIGNPKIVFNKEKVSLLSLFDVRALYVRFDENLVTPFTLLEGYGKYEFNSNWNIQTGKKLYKWGKGYIYNPVSYAGRPKDVNDIDAALEGYYSLSVQYNKSIDSKILKNFSQETVVIPVDKKVNSDYQTGDKHWFLNHSYLLILDADIDVFYNISGDLDYSVGFATAYNILTNWEVHAELSSVNLESIIGTRYLTSYDATFYLEYLYNGNDTFHLYFKAQYPEPFNLLYFTPSIYTLVNTVDQSYLSALDLNYKRFDNLSFNFKVVSMVGDKKSEYGKKMSKYKTELNIKYYF